MNGTTSIGGQIDPPVKTPVQGDVNSDGVFDRTDVYLLRDWLTAVSGTELKDWNAGDLNTDGRLNAADLTRMKQSLFADSTV